MSYQCDFGPTIKRNYTYASHPKIGVLVVIHAKNDAKEEEEEEKEKEDEEKENVGIFSPNLSFFGNQKNLKRELNLIFFLKRYGSHGEAPTTRYGSRFG